MALAACGTTTQVPPGGPGQTSDGLAVAPPPQGGAAAGGQSLPQGGAAGALGGGGAAVGAGTAANGSRTEATAPTATSAASAVAGHEPVRVGVLYVKDAGSGGSAIGVQGLETGDAQAQAKAVIAWINEHGAAAGHQLVPYFAGVSFEDSVQNPETAEQAACTQLTQDDHVQFVVSYLGLFTSTIQCFAKGGAAVLDDQSSLADWSQQRYASAFAAPGDLAPGRMLRELVDALWRTGWLTKTSKVGTYAYDDNDSRRLVGSNLAQALAAHGLKIAKEEFISNDGNGFAQSGNVTLQFRSAGVDRVIPVLASPLFIMHSASSQGYHPEYAMYSTFGPGALMETAAPKDQLTGSRGIGWSPYLDIGGGTHPGPVNANETLCFDIYGKSGQSSSAATTKGLQLNLCSVLLYLKFAADRVVSVPADLLGQARPLVGATFPPADTFRSDVRYHPDGAAGYRDLAYEQGCGCYQYVSTVHRTSR